MLKNYPTWQGIHKKHLEIPQMPISGLAINTIDHLPAMSKGNRWALAAICLHTSYVFVIPMKEKSAENVVQAYLSGILSYKGRSVVILSNNCTEFKNKVLSEVCDQLGIKRLFSNLFHSQENARVGNVQIF